MKETKAKLAVNILAVIIFLIASLLILGVYLGKSEDGLKTICLAVLILLISLGLYKRSNIARIGAYLVLIISLLSAATLLFDAFRPIFSGQIISLSLYEYFCIFWILLSATALIYLEKSEVKALFQENENDFISKYIFKLKCPKCSHAIKMPKVEIPIRCNKCNSNISINSSKRSIHVGIFVFLWVILFNIVAIMFGIGGDSTPVLNVVVFIMFILMAIILYKYGRKFWIESEIDR